MCLNGKYVVVIILKRSIDIADMDKNDAVVDKKSNAIQKSHIVWLNIHLDLFDV